MLIPLMVRFLSYFTNCRLKQLWGDYIRSGVIKSIIQHFCLWIQSPHNTQKLIHYSLTMILLFIKNQHLLSFFFLQTSKVAATILIFCLFIKLRKNLKKKDTVFCWRWTEFHDSGNSKLGWFWNLIDSVIKVWQYDTLSYEVKSLFPLNLIWLREIS